MTVIIWSGINTGLQAASTTLKNELLDSNSFSAIANVGISSITKGIEHFVNSAIDAVNTLINIYNHAVAVVGSSFLCL